MIVFSDVSKSFGGRTVIDALSFSLSPGEFVCVTGPSGAGKSTILHLLLRAEVPTSGRIEVDGVDLATLAPAILQMYRRRVGMMFQDYKLLGDRTVYENVAFALEVCGEPDDIITQRVPHILARVGLAGRENAFPSQLSGGEKARTALARALVAQPMILIADEPTGNIDATQAMEVLTLLQQAHAGGTTVLLASHDQRMIEALHTRVLHLENGKIVSDTVGGYPETSSTPAPASIPKNHEIFEENTNNDDAEAVLPTTSSGRSDDRPSTASGDPDGHNLPVPAKSPNASKKSGRVKPVAI